MEKLLLMSEFLHWRGINITQSTEMMYEMSNTHKVLTVIKPAQPKCWKNVCLYYYCHNQQINMWWYVFFYICIHIYVCILFSISLILLLLMDSPTLKDYYAILHQNQKIQFFHILPSVLGCYLTIDSMSCFHRHNFFS